ncbi:MAG: DUF2142 domain-containing protein [Chloroflexi bacterium]|nr:DUF2142 domain-containing protein [Chloroflexota bacterium]
MNPTRERLILGLIVLAYLALGVLFAFSSPPFEVSDELRHFAFVEHLARGSRLPVQRAGADALWEQEGSQPPLYYYLASRVVRAFDTRDFEQLVRLNPHARIGIPLAADNKNMVVHPPAGYTTSGTLNALHVLRVFGVLLGAGTLYAAYRAVRLVITNRPWLRLAVVGLIAFNPMFLFISASVNNDNLLNLWAALAFWLSLRLITRSISWRWLPAVGVLLGLAALTKLSGLTLAPLVWLAVLLGELLRGSHVGWRARIRQVIWPAVRAGLLLAVPVMLIGGWWYWRNWQLYGDPTGLNAMLSIVGGRTIPVTSLADLIGEFRGLRYSYWGLFGAVNILMQPTIVYRLLDLLSVAAGASLVWQLAVRWRRGLNLRAWQGLFALVWIIAYAVSLLRWASLTMASQGRLLFGALPAASLLLMLGLGGIPVRPLQRVLPGVLLGVLLALAVSSPWVIRAEYRPAPLITRDQIPADAQAYGTEYAGMMRLLATQLGVRSVSPGESVPIDLYWEVLAPMPRDYSIYLHAAGEGQVTLGQYDSYPGGGTRPTSSLAAGDILHDRYWLPISATLEQPIAAWISVGLYDLETMDKLPVVDPAGQAVGWPVIGRVRIAVPTSPPQPQAELNANLNNAVELVGLDLPAETVEAGGLLPFTLYWHVLRELPDDLTLFVHLVDTEGANHGSGDAPPLSGAYPTSFWAPGDWLRDPHTCQIEAEAAPGEYWLVVGLYNAITGERLSVVNQAGERKGDSIRLARITVR